MSLLQFTPIIRLLREMCCYNLELELERQLDRARAADLLCGFGTRSGGHSKVLARSLFPPRVVAPRREEIS